MLSWMFLLQVGGEYTTVYTWFQTTLLRWLQSANTLFGAVLGLHTTVPFVIPSPSGGSRRCRRSRKHLQATGLELGGLNYSNYRMFVRVFLCSTRFCATRFPYFCESQHTLIKTIIANSGFGTLRRHVCLIFRRHELEGRKNYII